MEPYRIFEHTADIGIEAFGRTLAEAFGNAARGMFSIIASPENIAPMIIKEIELKADDLEQLLVRWLSELLYYHGAEGLLFSEFDMMLDGGALTLKAKAKGEPFKPGRHEYRVEIKAVTYHMLEVEKEDGMWRVKVLFDI